MRSAKSVSWDTSALPLKRSLPRKQAEGLAAVGCFFSVTSRNSS